MTAAGSGFVGGDYDDVRRADPEWNRTEAENREKVACNMPQDRRKSRITVSELESNETARSTPLSRLVNFGPVTLREFTAMGLLTYGQLEDLGWEEVCRKWVESFPERLNVNAFIGVIATLEGIPWTRISKSDRAKARNLVSLLRQEYGIAGRRRS